ncbi:MAG: hypothetical protein RRZ65_09135 [Tannerellaceae bacterium]
MKTKLIAALLSVSFCLFLTGCKVGNVAVSQGLSDQSYLYFVSTQKYAAPVRVTIDGTTTFDAKVIKEGKHTVKGNTYAVATGKRRVAVSSGGKVVWEREVFLSTQETKKIILP